MREETGGKVGRPSQVPTLFSVGGTPVKVKPAVVANVLGLWGFMSWLVGWERPGRPWPVRLVVGALSTILLLVADVGHALAHIASAHRARAPMDEILISEGMPRTVYHDEDVPPQAHRMRALGGPIYSTAGLLSSLALRCLAPRDSLAWELAGWSSVGHGLILAGSVAPLPIVDGGSILKWTLVERGRSPEEADRVVRQVNAVIGGVAVGASVVCAARGRRLLALGLVAAGVVALAAAAGKVR